jgi:hypothetical protein
MAPIKITKRHFSSPGGCINCLSLGRFISLKDWIEICAASGKPEEVLGAALTYLTTVKELRVSVVAKHSIEICLHGKLRMWAEEMTLEGQRSSNPVNRVWSKNVPVVYDMLKCFNAYTAHQIALDGGDSLAYKVPLRIFKDEDFECLQDPRHVVELMLCNHRTVVSVVRSIELIGWTSD